MKLKNNSHVHFMGICGTAMASLAGMMKTLGHTVTGSDQNVYPPMSTQLENLGIKIQEGYKKENLIPKPDLVIVGNVIRRDYEEPQALLASDIPYTSLPKAIGDFVIEDRHSIVLSGTHGKTTTTSMMSWIAECAGLKPGFMIGGIPKNFSYSFKVPGGENNQKNYFVIEGDEYDTAFFDKVPKFIHYKPRSVILTSVEFDHADIYKDLDHVKSAFVKLMEMIPTDGNLVYWYEGEHVRDVVQSAHCKNIASYGLAAGDYQAHNIHYTKEFCAFDVVYKGKKLTTIELKAFGKHNILNALATFALSKFLKLEESQVSKALKTFDGVKRRQEIIGTPHGITVIEDFAHHPTAVDMTIESIKDRFQNQKVIALFEPRSATSRRNIFQKDYLNAFMKADLTILADVYNAGTIKEDERLSPSQIVSDLKSHKKEAFCFSDVDQIVSCVKNHAKSGDVVLVMSNGSFGGIYQKLLAQL